MAKPETYANNAICWIDFSLILRTDENFLFLGDFLGKCCHIYIVSRRNFCVRNNPRVNSPQINAHLRLHVRRIVLWRLTAKVHLALFIMVNLLVLSINWAFSPGNLWWLWMVTGWGLVFSAHVFYAVTRARVTPFQWHIFLYISVNLYLLFINLYTAHRITWCWIPWLSWSVPLVVNIVIKRDLVHSTEPLIIYAVLISDTDGKTLIQTEQRPQFLADVLHMNEANIELIPMFINAILQFSKEINMLDCNDFRLQSKKLKVVCYAERDLICTGFISFESNSSDRS